jgi:hypothetical protein
MRIPLKVNPVTRDPEFPIPSSIDVAVELVITVESMPAPFRVIFFESGIVTPVVHSHVPDGTMTTSPVLAVSIAALTCACEQLSALMVAAFTYEIVAILQAKTMNVSVIIILFMSLSSFEMFEFYQNSFFSTFPSGFLKKAEQFYLRAGGFNQRGVNCYPFIYYKSFRGKLLKNRAVYFTFVNIVE